MAADKGNKKKGDRISKLLYLIYLLGLLLGVAIIFNIVKIQVGFNPPQRILSEIKTRNKRVPIEPRRGQILASDGRVLAMSYTLYTIAMDCTVMRDIYKSDKKKGAGREEEWRGKARKFSEGLAKYLPKKDAASYYRTIINNRNRNIRYWKIADDVDNRTLEALRKLPLFNEGKYKGGVFFEKYHVRKYPYGSLGRRAIGLVNNNAENENKSHYGLEGRFEYILHGTPGYEWMREADGAYLVHNFDSSSLAPKNGQDVRSTLDVDIQDMLDKSLRKRLSETDNVEGGCGMVIDVRTGAIRAMVNLRKDKNGKLGETYNYCIGRLGEPGSVFKTVGLMSLIEDGYVKSVDESIPTNKGKYGDFPQDEYIPRWEAKHKTKSISIRDGLRISSNYVFRYLINNAYKDNPQRYLDKVYACKLGEAFEFDAIGLQTPQVPKYYDAKGKRSPYWSGTTLGSVAIGYSINETPLHILTFYNAIANKGKMMKPYLVENFEINGKVTEKRGPSILNASICSRATADTLTRALCAVTEEEGTAYWAFHGCKIKVVGKTGTSRAIILPEEDKASAGKYKSRDGRLKHQGTFVGFFPADEPQYTAIVTVYSKLSHQFFYGSNIPAHTVRDVVDGIYTTDDFWREVVKGKGTLPKANDGKPEIAFSDGIVPDVGGMGLKDALWALENAGYKCKFSGTGHVASQNPKGGARSSAGETITIELK